VWLTLQLGACTSWHIQSAPPVDVLTQQHPSRVRVTRANGERVVVYAPHPVGDSVEGFAAAPRVFRPGDSIRIALPEVEALATRQFSWGRSLALGAGGLVVGTVLVVLVECQTGCTPR
jgi:hypothetical protein